MKYQIIPQDETVMVTITENGISETLSMLSPPEDACMLVQKSRKDVLGEINLEKMLSNLDHCVDLLQITFNAVDGFSVQSKVQNLSNKFIDAMNESNATALDFKLASQTVLESYINAYGNLFYGETETAIMLLTDSRSIASRMVEKADALVQVYNGLTSYTNTVLTEVMNQRATDEQKRTETLALMKELEGSVKAMEALRDNLKKDIAQFEADYKKLQDREIKQEQRAYDMQLASLIISGIGALFGAGANAVNQNTKQDRDASEQQTESELGAPSAETKAKREYTENISKQEQQQAGMKKAEQRIAAIDKVLDGQLYKGGANNPSADPADPDTQKTDEELRTEKQKLVAEKGAASEELSKLKGQESALSSTLSGFGVAMDKVSEDTRNAAQEMQKTADALADRLDKIGRRRDELKDQERANVVKLAESTAKMQNMVMDANSLESAIQCLVIAVGCLRRVLAYLQEIKLFWMNVETFCDSLASNNSLQTMISMQEKKTAEQRAAYFKTILFVKGYIGVVAKWQALYVIFKEYLLSLAKVSKRMSATLEQSLSADRREQWKLATELAGNLKEQLDLELEDK